jgi:hypothetical protein
MQLNCDRLHVSNVSKPLPCRNLYPCTPTDRLDTLAYYLLLTSTMYYICDVMLSGGLFVSGYGTWCR